MSPQWASGDRELLFTANGMDGFSPLYRMPAAGSHAPVRVEGLGNIGSFGVSHDGRRLAYAVASSNTNIWRLDLATFQDRGTDRRAEASLRLHE